MQRRDIRFRNVALLEGVTLTSLWFVKRLVRVLRYVRRQQRNASRDIGGRQRR